jgi:zinc transporter 1/2/3
MEPTGQEATSDIVTFKVQAVIVMCITVLIGGFFPLKLRMQEKWLSYANIFGGGVFLSAGITNMLRESVEGFEKLDYDLEEFPFPYFLCLVGILFIFFIEKVLIHDDGHKHSSSSSHSHFDVFVEPSTTVEDASDRTRGIIKEKSPQKHDSSTMNVFVLAILMSIHSFVEGIALGVEDSVADARNVLIAILSHKLIDAFTFGTNLAKNANVNTQNFMKWLFLFSLVTPLGVVLGTSVFHNLNAGSGFAEIIQALSAGTFIYISLVEIILPEFDVHVPRFEKVIKFVLLFGGASLMAWVSVHHSHSGEGAHQH